MNSELAQLLVYLDAPDAAEKTMALLSSAPTQEEQIDYARDLRVLKTGWTPALRTQYFAWLQKASGYKGGNSFGGFLRTIRKDTTSTLSEAETSALKSVMESKAPSGP